MRILVALVILLLPVAAQTPDVPGLVPTLGSLGADEPLHDLATQPGVDLANWRSAINDGAKETTRTEALHFLRPLDAHGGPWAGAVGTRVGHTYHVTVSGTYQYAAGYVADAECSLRPDDPVWKAHRYDAQFGYDILDTWMVDPVAKTAIEWTPVEPFTTGAGESGCSTVNTYETTFTANDWYFYVALNDPTLSDNAGSLLVDVVGDIAPEYAVDYTCPKWVVEPMSGATVIGELETAVVHVDAHRDANWYPYPKDFAGILEPWHETGHDGIYTCNWVVPWATYTIEVTGNYTYASPNPLHPSLDAPLADAECSQGLLDPFWLSHREDHVVRPAAWGPAQTPVGPLPLIVPGGGLEFGTDYRDLTVNDVWPRWDPKSDPEAQCDPDNTYVLEDWSPAGAGWMKLRIRDGQYEEEDNFGSLTVRITRD